MQQQQRVQPRTCGGGGCNDGGFSSGLVVVDGDVVIAHAHPGSGRRGGGSGRRGCTFVSQAKLHEKNVQLVARAHADICGKHEGPHMLYAISICIRHTPYAIRIRMRIRIRTHTHTHKHHTSEASRRTEWTCPDEALGQIQGDVLGGRRRCR